MLKVRERRLKYDSVVLSLNESAKLVPLKEMGKSRGERTKLNFMY